MANTDVTALQRSDLNPFLFADIGTEANGTILSVLSVFARHGSDPWQEAARLAALSKPDATSSLAAMIASLPRSSWALPDATVIATRLTTLLPGRPVIAMGRTRFAWPLNRTVTLVIGIAVASGLAIITFQF